MENFDPEKAARVWQRVQGKAAPAPEENAPTVSQGLSACIAGEQTDAAAYLNLSRRFQGKQALLLQKMAQQEQAHAACLRGMGVLVGYRQNSAGAASSHPEGTEALLRRCYGRELQCIAAYEARTGDPQFGPVYAWLAAQEREHCCRILELLGSLREK